MFTGRLVPTTIALVLFSQLCSSTIAYSIWTPYEIVIGTDSASVNNERPRGHRDSRICKIKQVSSNCFYLIVGTTQLAHKPESVCSALGPLESRVKAYGDGNYSWAKNYLDMMRAKYPNSYRNIRQSSKTPVPLTVVYADGAEFAVSFIQYGMNADGELMPGVVTTQQGNFASKKQEAVFGHMELGDEYGNQHPEVYKLSPIQEVRTLIDGAVSMAKKHREDVIDYPVNVLVIDRNEPRWADQGECPAIDSELPLAAPKR
jgi:hypothetical protein